MERVELSWKAYFESPHAGATRYRDGSERRTTSRYFATKAEALAFQPNPKRVKYAPGEAWMTA